MIIRWVHMHFTESGTDDFLKLFEEVKYKVRTQDGCQHLSLMRNVADKQQISTYSIWESELKLNAYRNTAFFKSTWQKTKALFDERAQAKSFQVLDQII